ncbi:putative nuclease HARBI1 isoform X1 [Mya arenaria]|uniref:putative nuclease HARBI1 isoform X1 n=2 Tax=Mya arenaria TaxID=6604 RepID=UPI0022E3003D|nr:putative nuclease HARBI1 isoform X1 [Mya arenaria]
MTNWCCFKYNLSFFNTTIPILFQMKFSDSYTVMVNNWSLFLPEVTQNRSDLPIFRRRSKIDTSLMLTCSNPAPVRVEGYVPDVVSMYSDVEFQSHLRMHRSTFEELCKIVAPDMARERSISLETRMLATLWMLGNMECYRSVADRFGISKGTLHLTVMSSSKALCQQKSNFINFPTTRREMDQVAEGFSARCGIPGIVGAVDGTHVPVPGPRSQHRASFINRKGYPSIQLQVVCDSKLRLLDTYTGWPGSVHDARVFRNCPLLDVCQQLPAPYHLIGDSAYPLSRYMLVPYRDNGHLDAQQKKFNKAHSSTRVDVERAIGLLKSKFRRLKNLDMLLAEQIPEVITACCVLHNFILDREGEDVVEDVEYDSASVEEEGCSDSLNAAGEEKRRNIANLL